jgi:tetratricopeptide (TPR) repeat protein
MFITYDGGPVFDLRVRPAGDAPVDGPTPAALADIKTGDDADRLGRAELSRREFAQAKTYLDRAVALDPASPDYLVHRANAERGLRRYDLVKADLDQAISLKPNDETARLQRGGFYLIRHNLADARADFDAAIAAHPENTKLQLGVASVYDSAGEFSVALDIINGWIAAHPHDDAMAAALNQRCWVRAQWNRDMDKALADCDQSLRLQREAQTFDSRGLVHLRLGQLDQAISDYNTALRMQPQIAWSLYGRGLAEQAKGLSAPGAADMKLATALDPGIAVRATNLGLTQPLAH